MLYLLTACAQSTPKLLLRHTVLYAIQQHFDNTVQVDSQVAHKLTQCKVEVT